MSKIKKESDKKKSLGSSKKKFRNDKGQFIKKQDFLALPKQEKIRYRTDKGKFISEKDFLKAVKKKYPVDKKTLRETYKLAKIINPKKPLDFFTKEMKSFFESRDLKITIDRMEDYFGSHKRGRIFIDDIPYTRKQAYNYFKNWKNEMTRYSSNEVEVLFVEIKFKFDPLTKAYRCYTSDEFRDQLIAISQGEISTEESGRFKDEDSNGNSILIYDNKKKKRQLARKTA